MYVRLPIVGAGVPGDPRTVLMPTWSCITEVANGTAMIVWIPDDDAPDDHDAMDTPRYTRVNGVPILIGVTPFQRLKWHLKLARKWGNIMAPPTPDLV